MCGMFYMYEKRAHIHTNTHTFACIGVHWAERGRRHENVCKITDRKNGNTARARATVNSNNKLLLLEELAVGSVSVSVVCVFKCAIADGRTVDICVENALVLRLVSLCISAQSKIQNPKSRHRYSFHVIQTTLYLCLLERFTTAKVVEFHFLKLILLVGRTISPFVRCADDSRLCILHKFVNHQNSNTFAHSHIPSLTAQVYYAHNIRMNLLRSEPKLNGW